MQREPLYTENTKMLKLLSLTAALTLALMVGCNKETENAKTPGKSTPPEASTYKLTLPDGATDIAKEGEEKVTIGVDRGDNMKSAVNLTFEPTEGITVVPDNPTIPADKDEVEVMVKVGKDVAKGETAIKVTGDADGKKTDGTFKIEVTED